MERYADDLGHSVRMCAPDQIRLSETSLPGTIAGRHDTAFGRRWARYWMYPRHVRTCTSDVFHIVDQGYGDLLRVLPPERTVVTCHDLMLLRGRRGHAGDLRVRRTTLARFRWSVGYLRRAAAIICPSITTRNDVLRFLSVPSDRITIIPQGVNPSFRPSTPGDRSFARRQMGLSDDTFVLLHVSTGHPYKNNAAVLHTLAHLRRSGQQWILIRAGRRLRSHEFALAQSLGITSHLRDLGKVTDARLAKLYAGSDVFLFPSFSEGFGWPVLEALATGLPVVASSSAPSLREIAADSALYAAPDDIGGLASHATQLCVNAPLRAQQVTLGLERSRRFCWPSIAQQYVNVYRSVAERATRAATYRKSRATS